MKNLGKDLSQTVLKLADHVNLSEYNLDVKMLNVAWAMDGKRSLHVIAQEDHYDPKDLIEKVSYLLELGVIEMNKSSHSIIDREFIDFLTGQLSKSLGPVADILIADTAKSLGHPMSNFPVHKLVPLIDLLAQEISGQEETIVFKRVMASMAKKKNY